MSPQVETRAGSAQPPVRRPTRLAGGAALLLLGATSAALALGAIEVALRFFGPRERQYHVLVPNMRQVFEPRPEFFRGLAARSRYSTNEAGLRGGPIPTAPSAHRILAIGGSTTENIYLDDARTWSAILEARLSEAWTDRTVWVGAAGRSGMNSRDHILHVERLLPQLPRIDRILVLVGVNDLSVALAQGDSFRAMPLDRTPEALAAAEARAFSIVPGALHESRAIDPRAAWYRRTALWQMGASVRQNLERRRVQAPLRQDTRGAAIQRWREKRQRATTWRDRPPPLDSALATFQRHLEAIADAAERHGVQLSFLTQPALWDAGLDSAGIASLWLGGVGDFQRDTVSTYFTHGALRVAMDAYNQRLLAVCAARGLRCFDVAAHVPRSTAMFVDDVHFTEAGSQAVGEAVAEWLRSDSSTPTLARR